MTGEVARDPDGPGAVAPQSLRAVRLGLGLSSRAVAEQVGVTTACLLRWERRQRTPSPELMAALAGVLRLPVDQAAAFFAESGHHPPVDDTMPGYGLRALRKSRRVPPRCIAEALRVTVQTVYNWERGGSRLPVRLLDPLAGCLGMDTEELVKALRAARRDSRAVVRLHGELASLRSTADFSQSRVADLLGVSRTTLRGWERGDVVPPWQAIRLMASLYQVPLAVVATAAKAGKPRFLDPENWLPGDLPEVLRVLRQWNGLTQARVAEHCGTSDATVRGWEHARQRPRASQRGCLENLYRLPPGSLLRAYPSARPTSARVDRDAC